MEEHNNEILTIVENNIVEQKKQLDEINNHIEKKMEEEKNIERNSNYCKTLLSCCTMLASVVL